MAETPKIEEHLFINAARECKTMPRGIVEDLPKLSDAGITDDIGWIVGFAPNESGVDEVRYSYFYFSDHSRQAEQLLIDVISDIECDRDTNFLIPQDLMKKSGVKTIAFLTRTVQDDGTAEWLLYHHPMIDSNLACGYLLRSLETERVKQSTIC